MNAHLIRPLILGVFALPLLVAAQQGGEGRVRLAVVGGLGPQGLAVTVPPGEGSVPGCQLAGGAAMPAGQGAGISGPTAKGTRETVRYSDPGNNFFSNVPINELSAKAYRRFHRRFREVGSGEYWFKYEQGYQVSFTLDQHHAFAYFDPAGVFLYSLKYSEGKELPKDMELFVKRRFPDYKIDVVTEVNNGQGTFYLLQIMNADKIKVLTIADGRVDVVKEMTNGSANIGPAEAAR